MKIFAHELGREAKDVITGFSGVITARCQFLTGCNRYCLQPRELKDGKIIDAIYFDEDQIELIGHGISEKKVRGDKPGACAPNPNK